VNRYWDDDERAAFEPVERISTDEWAKRYRKLSRRDSASRPGPWSDLNEPILRGFMKLLGYPGINEVWCQKFAQGGFSEAIRNRIGHRAHLSPCPVQIVLPNREKGREIVRKRLLPMFAETEVLAAQLTGRKMDAKMSAITLRNGFELSLAYAGSPASIASDPYEEIYLDEVDRYAYSGDQANPIDEARTRSRTFGDRGLLVAISTPGVPTGPIAVGFEACPVKLYYFACCPHCGTHQRLVFDNLKWDVPLETATGERMTADQRAAWVYVRKSAWMQCVNIDCAKVQPAGRGRILDQHKRQALTRGYWGTADGTWKIWFDGRLEGGPGESNRVGVQAGAFVSMPTSFAKIAAEFIAADGRPEKLKPVYNVTFGEPFHRQVSATTASVIADKCHDDAALGRVLLPPKIVPPWVSRLVMTVDTQKDHFWYVIRGWGFNYRSARVDHGRVSTFAELEALQLDARWHYECDVFAPLAVDYLGIDTGGGIDDAAADATRTDQVYQWCNQDAQFRIPLKGFSKPFEQRLMWREVTYQDPHHKRDPYRVRLHFIDPLYWRDLLDSYITGRITVVDQTTGESSEVERWSLNLFNDPEYNRHLSNLHKVQIKRGNGYIERWQPKTQGGRHDYDDCERYQLAMAHGPAHCGMLPSPEQIAEQRRLEKSAAVVGGTRMPDGRPYLANRR